MFKAVGRFFKKVGKAVLKVAPWVALGAAAFFTAGAALGLTAGWGAAVSGFMAKIGLSGTLANVIGGSIAQAGYGAIAGGAIGALTGKGFKAGVKGGFVTGLATGGVSGLFGVGPGIQPGAEAPSSAVQAGTHTAAEGSGFSGLSGVPAAKPAPSLLSRVGGAAKSVWSEVKDSSLAGNVIAGLGQGIAGSAELDALESRRLAISGSYEGLDMMAGLDLSPRPTSSAQTAQASAPSAPSLVNSNTLSTASDRILRKME